MSFAIFAFPSTAGAVAIAVLVLLYAGYRLALPHPIQGIPYNKNAVSSILGDIPAMVKSAGESKEVLIWLQKQCVELGSPIVQVFIRPFGVPTVLICDFREMQDVLMRRLKEFDRSAMFMDIFIGVLPNHHIIMPTDAKFKNQRRMLGDTMTPRFLTEVGAPLIYSAVEDMLQLWRLKAKLSQGRPFEAATDIAHLALDAIWVAAFATPIDTLKSQVQLLSSIQSLENLPESGDAAVEMPKARTPAAFDAIITLTDTFAPLISSPAPRLHHWFIRQMPYYRKALASKDQLLADHMTAARGKFAKAAEKEELVQSAIDLMFQREVIQAEKDGREPVFDSASAKDELFGYLIAGHETTATTLSWGMKLLADNPQVTDQLRSILYKTLASDLSPASTSSQTSVPPAPSPEAIARATMPYLDAVIEEILRMGVTASTLSRKALCDTEILGYAIPKGTDIFFMTNGPSFVAPPFEIAESKRSESSRKAVDARGMWDVSDIGVFRPERWLSPNGDKGEVVFDGRAGPNAQFGFGPRGCFGKRLAYLEMRLVITLILWHFKLLKCPPELSTYAAEDKLTHHPQNCYVRLEVL
jgi:cytochrome P450